MNFNFAKHPEHNLHSSLIDELINLYGIMVKLVIVERVNEDKIVFGDFSHLLSDNTRTFEIPVLPENMDDFNRDEFRFSQFGLENYDTIDLFVHRQSIDNIQGVEHIIKNNGRYTNPRKPSIVDLDHHLVGNLLVLPSGKVMEISEQSVTTPGINNMFTYKNEKTVYRLTCVPYRSQLVSEVDSNDISTIGSEVDEVEGMIPSLNLEDYFDELKNDEIDQDLEAEVHERSNTAQWQGEQKIDDANDVVDIKKKDTIINNDELQGWD